VTPYFGNYRPNQTLSVERYIFKLRYALRSLPDERIDAIVEDVRAWIDERVEHEIELGYGTADAYHRALQGLMTPDRMAKSFIAAHNRRLAAMPGLVEASLLLVIFGSLGMFLLPQARNAVDITQSLVLMFVAAVAALRVYPIDKAIRIRFKALRVAQKISWPSLGVAAVPIFLTLKAIVTVSGWPPTLSAALTLEHMPLRTVIAIVSLIVLERNRRELGAQHRLVNVLADDSLFAKHYFRITEHDVEQRRRFGYFTEDID